ncbi:unnamed protein product [marine sediment metagenome]|uniref:Uncharacterized protein n=1 Tax=marine sediment metagenome TaxID=412755 RepID=X1VU24_9ZZZZ
MKEKNIGRQEHRDDFNKGHECEKDPSYMWFLFRKVIYATQDKYQDEIVDLEHNQVIPEIF